MYEYMLGNPVFSCETVAVDVLLLRSGGTLASVLDSTTGWCSCWPGSAVTCRCQPVSHGKAMLLNAGVLQGTV